MPIAVKAPAIPAGNWVKGCDFSYSKPDLQKLWDAGYRVILGYLSDTPGKGLDAAYITQALAIGFKIIPLYETTARAALGGRAAGVTQATAAMRIGATLGMPAGVTVIFALDSDYTTAEMATVSAFVDGLHSVTGSDGEYGGVDQLQYLIAHKTADVGRLFMTYAWQHGAAWLPASSAPIEQIQNGVSVAGGVIDVCRVDVDNPSLTLWEPDMADITDPNWPYLTWRGDALTHMHDTIQGGPEKGKPVELVVAVKAAQTQSTANGAAIAALASKVAALPTTAAPAAPIDDATVQRIAKAVLDMLDARLAS